MHVVMTADALRFITAAAVQNLSRNPVVTDLYDEEEGWKPTHIALADEADLLLIAPATANIIAKLAHGIADDALTCIALALNPKAKDSDRSRDERQNVAAPGDAAECARTLKSRGAEFIGPEEGCFRAATKGSAGLWPDGQSATWAGRQLK